MKSLSRAGPRSPALSECWLSATSTPWLVESGWPVASTRSLSSGPTVKSSPAAAGRPVLPDEFASARELAPTRSDGGAACCPCNGTVACSRPYSAALLALNGSDATVVLVSSSCRACLPAKDFPGRTFAGERFDLAMAASSWAVIGSHHAVQPGKTRLSDGILAGKGGVLRGARAAGGAAAPWLRGWAVPRLPGVDCPPARRDLLFVVDHDVVVRHTRCASAFAAQREHLAILGNGASGRTDDFAAFLLCALDRVVIDLFQRQGVKVG